MKITNQYGKPIRDIQPGETAVIETPFSLNGLHNKQYDLEGNLINHTTYYPSSAFKSGEVITPIGINQVPMLCIAGASVHSADEIEFVGPLTKNLERG
jgi:hypothetical protein